MASGDSGSGSGSDPNQGFNFKLPSQSFNFGASGQGFNFSSSGQNSNAGSSKQDVNNQAFVFKGPSERAPSSLNFDFNSFNNHAFAFGSSASGINFNLARPSPVEPPHWNLAPPTTDLCRDCALLDLEAAFTSAHSLYEGGRRGKNTRRIASTRSQNGPAYLRDFYFVTSLGTRLAEDRGCKLCSFFKQHVDEPEKGTYKILAICSSEMNLFEPPRRTSGGEWIRPQWKDIEYNVFLAVVPEVVDIPRTGIPLRWLESDLPRKGGIYRLTENVRGEHGKRLVLPEKLGSKFARSTVDYWIRTCSRNHGTRCSPKKPAGSSLRGFRAIDCTKNPPIVRDISWSEKYVALSYVWGNNSEQWPQTVKDAVDVTRMLGYEYLWVDRLCIDQSNPDEKMFLVSKMDAIYEGAEITIINAAGDASAGLPGVGGTPRTLQPRVELDLTKGKSVSTAGEKDIYLELLNVPQDEYERETAGHRGWLDPYRHGLQNFMTLDMSELLEKDKRKRQWNIPDDHYDFFEDTARHFGTPFDDFMEKAQELARRMGIGLVELVPFLQRESAQKAGDPIPDEQPVPPLGPPTITDPSKPETPLPPGQIPGKTVLVSTMQGPRITIRKSQWATRGWTYQEGVLSRRCLVFTPEQVYWECRCMAVNESIRLPLAALHSAAEGGSYWAFAPYMLSGIFRGDMHRAPELQYGFPEEDEEDDVKAQVARLDSHIRSFTSRKLTDHQDSWNAFLGVAARYTGNVEGLSLLLGIPYWEGLFGDGQPALQHSFAMSVSVWFHVGLPVEPASRLYAAICARRTQFPSWSWIGWEGTAEFNGCNVASKGSNADGDDDGEAEDDLLGDSSHTEFFMAMTSSSWASSINRIWSADMVLQSEDGSASAILQGNIPLYNFADQAKKWLLVVKNPLVLKHLHMMHSRKSGEWRRLMGKLVEIHLSVPLTEEQLTAGHKSGDLVTVLIFASTVPFIWDGMARFLILRRANNTGVDLWERIGRLVLGIEEHELIKYQSSQDMVNHLPVRSLGRDIALV
ncbi:hypothetical protein F4802DRAFT_597140 [Xylaria palmicola]|nr:hypothetical protein F4802DRAFT_597140 [Xylaria palmicola]